MYLSLVELYYPQFSRVFLYSDNNIPFRKYYSDHGHYFQHWWGKTTCNFSKGHCPSWHLIIPFYFDCGEVFFGFNTFLVMRFAIIVEGMVTATTEKNYSSDSSETGGNYFSIDAGPLSNRINRVILGFCE